MKFALKARRAVGYVALAVNTAGPLALSGAQAAVVATAPRAWLNVPVRTDGDRFGAAIRETAVGS